MALILINHNKKIDDFGVRDPNLIKNANEIIIILCKKNYWDLMKKIENILKLERQKKVEKSQTKLFSTVGPNMFYKSLFILFEIIKNKKEEIILDHFLNNTKQITIQYLIGLDTIVRVN